MTRWTGAGLRRALAGGDEVLYRVVPDKEEKAGVLPLTRPALKNNGPLVKNIQFSGLRLRCDALCRFGIAAG